MSNKQPTLKLRVIRLEKMIGALVAYIQLQEVSNKTLLGQLEAYLSIKDEDFSK